ncbi:MAG: NUDIX domain-containing protein, partial [Planctomycetota bacterium]
MDSLKLQSGAIPHLEVAGEVHLVLITSHTTGGWVLPKGSIEPGMTPEESAANEAFEEAGVIG